MCRLLCADGRLIDDVCCVLVVCLLCVACCVLFVVCCLRFAECCQVFVV